MRLIVGLGNPGKEYEKTRHNVGFMFLDKLALHPAMTNIEESLSFKKSSKFQAEIAETLHRGEKIVLAKPSTFMNLSGETVAKITKFYHLESKNIVVVTDDVELPLGTVRVRKEGSSGGHNGLQNIIERLGTDKFDRIRIGACFNFSKKEAIERKNYVLAPFPKREKAILDETIDDAVDYLVKVFGLKTELQAHTFEVETT